MDCIFVLYVFYSILTSVVALHYHYALFLRQFSSRYPLISSSSMTTGSIMLSNGTLAGQEISLSSSLIHLSTNMAIPCRTPGRIFQGQGELPPYHHYDHSFCFKHGQSSLPNLYPKNWDKTHYQRSLGHILI